MPDTVFGLIGNFLHDAATNLPGRELFQFSLLCKRTQIWVAASEVDFALNFKKEVFLSKM